MNMKNISLVAFIESHDGCTVLQDNKDSFLVETNSCNMITGEAFRQQEVIPATRKAVRDWLGY